MAVSFLFYKAQIDSGDVAELADALDLGSSVLWTCRFDSCHPHLGFYRVKSIHAVRAFFVAEKTSGTHREISVVPRSAVLSNELATTVRSEKALSFMIQQER